MTVNPLEFTNSIDSLNSVSETTFFKIVQSGFKDTEKLEPQVITKWSLIKSSPRKIPALIPQIR